MGSDESHFNVSLIVKVKVTICEEKGEPKRIRTEVPLITSLTPLPLGQTGSLVCSIVLGSPIALMVCGRKATLMMMS